jgi:hypothetical protein
MGGVGKLNGPFDEPPIHEGSLDNLVVGYPCVRLQDDRQRQLCWSNGGLTSFTRPVQARSFLLERLIQQLLPMVAKKHKQLGSLNPLDDLFLLFRKFHRGLPERWLHLSFAFLVAFRFVSPCLCFSLSLSVDKKQAENTLLCLASFPVQVRQTLSIGQVAMTSEDRHAV